MTIKNPKTKTEMVRNQIIGTTISLLIAACTAVFLFGCWRYETARGAIRSDENELQKLLDPALQDTEALERSINFLEKEIDNKKEELEELISSSDVARYCDKSEETLTGVVIYTLALIISLLLFIASIYVIVGIIGIDAKILLKKFKRIKEKLEVRSFF